MADNRGQEAYIRLRNYGVPNVAAIRKETNLQKLLGYQAELTNFLNIAPDNFTAEGDTDTNAPKGLGGGLGWLGSQISSAMEQAWTGIGRKTDKLTMEEILPGTQGRYSSTIIEAATKLAAVNTRIKELDDEAVVDADAQDVYDTAVKDNKLTYTGQTRRGYEATQSGTSYYQQAKALFNEANTLVKPLQAIFTANPDAVLEGADEEQYNKLKAVADEFNALADYIMSDQKIWSDFRLESDRNKAGL
jgi:hypothetical protein